MKTNLSADESMLPCLALLAFWFSGLAFQAKPAADLLREANEAYRSTRSDEAVRLYTEYLKQDTSNAVVRTFLSAALFNLNRLGEAKRELTQALATNASLPKAYVLLGRIDAAEGAWDKAQASFTRSMNLDPSDRDALYFSGRAFYDANRFEPAIERFESALTLGATQSRTYENLALCYEALHQPTKAESAYRSAVESAGDQYRPYFSYGRFLFKEGRLGQSVSALKQAFERAPDVTEVRFELARSLYQTHSLPDAAQILRGALASNQCRVHNLMAKILASEGKKTEADREIASMAGCTATGT